MPVSTKSSVKFALTGVLIAVYAIAAGALAEEDITACDLEVAHPSDPDRIGPGKPTAEVVTHLAIPACRAAVAEAPENPRFHYQLARALVYWADANDGDVTEAMQHLETAAASGYRQAQFVLGLMHVRAGNVCDSEPLTRSAADQGLKSARISYVNAVTAGDYDACAIGATHEEMLDYLDGAASQVNGYYENMLLASLRRQLDRRGE